LHPNGLDADRSVGHRVTFSNESMERENMSDENLTVEEAAAYLGVSVSWLYELRRQGRGPTSWVGEIRHRLVYPKSELDLFRARRRQRTLRGDVVNA
jgi:excisionase family DNA binding protein